MIKIKKIWVISAFVMAIAPLSVFAFSSGLFDEKIFEDLNNAADPASGSAANSRITNEISVSASTGNNTVSPGTNGAPGEVKEGKKEASIKIKSTINGKEIDPVDIKSDSGNAKVESKIEADGEKARVERKTEVGSEKKSENYEVDLKKSETSTVKPESTVKAESTDKSDKKEAVSGSTADSGKKTLERGLGYFRSRWSVIMESLRNFFRNLFDLF